MSSRRLLFGNNSSMPASRKNLLEFKAGKMAMKGKMVHPDTRKGLVYLHQTDDSLMHFCWKDRTTSAVVDDLIIFPDDVEYKRVNECKTGRVYVLKFKTSSRKFFFWMQEPKTDKDEENCNKVNELLNNPPAPGSGGGSGAGGGGVPSDLAGEGDFHNLLNNMNQQQLMQLFGGMGGLGGMSNILGSGASRSSTSSSQSRSETTATTTAAAAATTTASTPTASVTPSTAASTTSSTTTTTSTPSANQVRLADLQNILSSLNVPADASEGAAQQAAQGHNLDLSSALTQEVMQPLLNNAEFMQQLSALLPQTPGSSSNATDEVKTTIQSPQFQQAMGMFSAALQSGQLGPLMNQFGMGQDIVTAATSGDMEAFLKALQNSQESKKPKEQDKNVPKKDDKDDDEGMSLD